MAKKPKDDANDGITYFGEAIDPDIQKNTWSLKMRHWKLSRMFR